MNKLVCEMCSGNDFLKQDGMFVCQSCGTKYTVEEARKMMIEGTVDVSGSTVKIDDGGRLEKLFTSARRARDDGNWESAQKYYEMILVDDPNSWEAIFYSTYSASMQTNIAGISNAILKVRNCLTSVFTEIKNNVPAEEQDSAIREVVDQTYSIAAMMSVSAENHYNGISQDIKAQYTGECQGRIQNCFDTILRAGDKILDIFGEEKIELARNAYKIGVKAYLNRGWFFFDNLKTYAKRTNDERLIRDVDMTIKKYEKKEKAGFAMFVIAIIIFIVVIIAAIAACVS